MKKYLCIGENVISQNDREHHYINPHVVARLYGVDPKDCIFANDHDVILIDQAIKYNPNIIELRPRYDGNYKLSGTMGEGK